MKKAIVDRWIKALRSGKYKQGQGQLRSIDNRFCPLGVLCNLHAQAHPKIAKQQAIPQVYMSHDAYLPPQVRAWAGMKSNVGYYGDGLSLTWLNDQKKFTFKKIANVIEKHREEL